MSILNLEELTFSEIQEYVDKLEADDRRLTAKTDNTKKLLRSEVARIRILWGTGNWSQKDLAEAFMVNPATISRIVRGVYYKDVS